MGNEEIILHFRQVHISEKRQMRTWLEWAMAF